MSSHEGRFDWSRGQQWAVGRGVGAASYLYDCKRQDDKRPGWRERERKKKEGEIERERERACELRHVDAAAPGGGWEGGTGYVPTM